MNIRPIHFVFGCLIVLLLLMLSLFFLPREIQQVSHPEYGDLEVVLEKRREAGIQDVQVDAAAIKQSKPIMLKGQSKLAEQPLPFSIAILICFMILGVMASVVFLGHRKGPEKKIASKWWLLGGFLIYFYFFARMIESYHAFHTAQDYTFLWGYPMSTAWMIYDIWLFPVFIMVFFLITFSKWFWTDADEVVFEKLLDQKEQEA